jgi:DNA-binding NtrC family response regulator
MKKIFILDDNEDFLDIIQLVLQDNYIVTCKQNPQEIEAALVAFKPDLLIIDHFIGHILAENVLNNLKQSMPGFNIPFILFSAASDIKEKAERLGAAGYIEKPFSIDHIRNYIAEFFNAKLETTA